MIASVWIPLLFYGLLFAVFALVAVMLYMRSVATRKRWRCPQCGEVIRTEHMQARSCPVCGADLRED